MPYPELMIAPMRKELTRLGIEELLSPDDVDAFMEKAKGGTAMVVVNSMCGCASGSMRPAVAMALEHGTRPEHIATVFAGQEVEATARAREYIVGYPPSSPSIALFKDGQLAFMLERHQIQGRHPMEIAEDLMQAFDAHCGEKVEG
ncbi:MAG TPA: BrxA/BrxB family bacilliredoxin [Longimicrobiales bacterium]